MDLYSRICYKKNELIRAGMVHLLSGALGLFVVNEFPKSGGTWVHPPLSASAGSGGSERPE